MLFTTLSHLRKLPKSAFTHDMQLVVYGGEEIGMLIGTRLMKELQQNGLLEQIREELWEANDLMTRELCAKASRHDDSASIDFQSFSNKYKI